MPITNALPEWLPLYRAVFCLDVLAAAHFMDSPEILFTGVGDDLGIEDVMLDRGMLVMSHEGTHLTLDPLDLEMEFETERDLGAIDGFALKEALFSARQSLERSLADLCRYGAFTVFARPDSPLEPFIQIAPDAFGSFMITDWYNGIAKTRDGNKLVFSLHFHIENIEESPQYTLAYYIERLTQAHVVGPMIHFLLTTYPDDCPDEPYKVLFAEHFDAIGKNAKLPHSTRTRMARSMYEEIKANLQPEEIVELLAAIAAGNHH